jgi:hypothetical protein
MPWWMLLLTLPLAGCSTEQLRTTGLILGPLVGAVAAQQLELGRSLSQQSAAFTQRQLDQQDQFFEDTASPRVIDPTDFSVSDDPDAD